MKDVIDGPQTSNAGDKGGIEALIDLGRPVQLGGHPQYGLYATWSDYYGKQFAKLAEEPEKKDAVGLLEIWLARFTSGFEDGDAPYNDLLRTAKRLIPLAYQNTEKDGAGIESTRQVHQKIESLVDTYIGRGGMHVNQMLGNFSDAFVLLIDKHSGQKPLFPAYRFNDKLVVYNHTPLDEPPLPVEEGPAKKLLQTVAKGSKEVTSPTAAEPETGTSPSAPAPQTSPALALSPEERKLLRRQARLRKQERTAAAATAASAQPPEPIRNDAWSPEGVAATLTRLGSTP